MQALIEEAEGAIVATGFAHLDADGKPDPTRSIDLAITGRMAYVFSLGALMGLPGTRRYADHVLGRLGLAELGDRHPSSLSGGQKQRLSIACGLASRRSVLILDEPTSGLDALSMRRLADALRCAAEEGAAVVVITHDNEFMRECCTHVFALEGAGADEDERRAR